MKAARVVLMVLVAAVLAAGTILEKIDPTVHIYNQWWFVALLAIVAVAAIVSIVQGRMWKRIPLLLVHTSIPVILLGGALTTWTSERGDIKLLPGQANRTVTTEDNQSWDLPFDVTLNRFELENYTGTRTPMDFVSHVTVEGKAYDISMNHILRHHGYRFYQSDYDTDGSSTLSVSRDTWGIATTYCGYILLLLGLLGIMIVPTERYRRLLKGAVMAAILLIPTLQTSAAPRTLPRETAEQMGRMHVLYQGRICPLQTLAKDFTTKLTGNATYHGLTSEQVLAGYLFYYSDWANEPALKIKGAKELNLSKHCSVSQLYFLENLPQTPATGKNTRSATEKLNLVRMLLSGRMLKLFPVEGNWYGQNDELPPSVANDEYIFIRRWQSYCQEQVMEGNMEELEHIFAKTKEYQEKHIAISKGRTRV